MSDKDVVNVIAQSITTALQHTSYIISCDRTVTGTIKKIITGGYQVELLGSLYDIKETKIVTLIFSDEVKNMLLNLKKFRNEKGIDDKGFDIEKICCGMEIALER